MGEYWKPVNVSRREYIHPHHMNEGLKLAEWTSPGSNVLALMASWDPREDIRILSDYGGDIRVTESARASAEPSPDYDTLESAFAEKSLPSGSPSAAVPALTIAAAAGHIQYSDWHDAWLKGDK